jgi:ATP/maltotriose-dependent transcriptional regulator MalT
MTALQQQARLQAARMLGQYDEVRRRLRALESATTACNRARLLDKLGLNALRAAERRPAVEAALRWGEAETAWRAALQLSSGACPKPTAIAKQLCGLAKLALARGQLEQAREQL